MRAAPSPAGTPGATAPQPAAPPPPGPDPPGPPGPAPPPAAAAARFRQPGNAETPPPRSPVPIGRKKGRRRPPPPEPIRRLCPWPASFGRKAPCWRDKVKLHLHPAILPSPLGQIRSYRKHFPFPLFELRISTPLLILIFIFILIPAR
ncbi:MAG: hypothetical protein EBT50_08835 [Verrucomicrobia bacterium]|nr:hypothetical protein [Verrucomicrobiota bacterium]